jgi:UDP-2-acetamido-3-amino-2,3-dideoxy-glucuronate N-acetyltransferase
MQYGGIKTMQSLQEVLCNNEMNAVAIATPPSLHASMVQQALEADKDVFVEKPLALTEKEGEVLVELAERRQRILMVGHLLWYHPAVLRLKDLVAQGELGRLQYIYSHRLNLGRIRREENILWSFAPHDISIILGLLGEMPDVVQAQGGNYLHQQIADVTVSMLSFPSGVKAHVFVSWLHPYKEQKLVVVGDRKMAAFNDLELECDRKLLVYPHTIEWRGNFPVPSQKQAEEIPVASIEPLRAECEHFLECVVQGTTPRTDGREGLRVLRVLQQCQDALEKVESPGRPRERMTRKTASSQRAEVHPSATVDEGAEIGAGTKIWHYSHVMGSARIGRECVLGQNVFVGHNVVIGDNVKIQNNVSVYEGVELEDNVFCGPSVVFTNVINPRSEIERKSEFRHTLVRRGATLGANSTIVCGVTIGRYAFIGAGAVVTKDVPDYALVVGSPARVVKWMCVCGTKLVFTRTNGPQAEQAVCSGCGAAYVKREGGVQKVATS